MHEGLGKRVKDALVEIGVLPGDFQRDILAALLGDIAKEARETAEELLDGHHSNLEHALVKLIKNARLKSNGIGEFCAHRITSMPLVRCSRCFRKPHQRPWLPAPPANHRAIGVREFPGWRHAPDAQWKR